MPRFSGRLGWGFRPALVAIDLVRGYTEPGVFSGTSLASTLGAAGVDTVVVRGLSTSGCVRATATDAMTLGLAPVMRQACTDRMPAPHRPGRQVRRRGQVGYGDRRRTAAAVAAIWVTA
jgi:nicotinamidase-related amidase